MHKTSLIQFEFDKLPIGSAYISMQINFSHIVSFKGSVIFSELFD